MASATAAADVRFLRINKDMSDLTATAVSTADDLAVYDDTAADTRSECNEHKVPKALRGSLPHLAERCRIGIVERGAVKAREFLHAVCHVEDPPSEVRALHDCSVRLNGSWHSDTHSDHIVLIDLQLSEHILHSRSNILRHLLATVRAIRPDLPLLNKLTFTFEDTQLYGSTSNICAYNILRHSVLLIPISDFS